MMSDPMSGAAGNSKSCAVALPILGMLCVLSLLTATGCGWLWDEDSGEGPGAEVNADETVNANNGELRMSFSSPHLSSVSQSSPIAVGYAVEVTVHGVAEVEEVIVENADIFEVEEIDGTKMTIRAIAVGQSGFDVSAEAQGDGPTQGSFELRAELIVDAEIIPECSILDMAGPLLGAEYDGDKVWLTDQVYGSTFEITGEEDTRLHGADIFPFSFAPPEAAQFDEKTYNSVEIITGPDEVDGSIESSVSDASVEFPVIHELDRVSEINVVRLESEGDESHFSITEAGAEPILDLVENKAFFFLPHRFDDGRTVCEPLWDIDTFESPEYQVRTLTPGVCLVDDQLSSNPDDFNPRETLTLQWIGALRLYSPGECVVEMEFLGGPGEEPLVEEFRWTVE